MPKRPEAEIRRMRVRVVVIGLFNRLTVPVDDEESRAAATAMAEAAGVDPDNFVERWFGQWQQRLEGTLAISEACLQRAFEAMGALVDESAIARAVEVRMQFSRVMLQARTDAVPTLARLRELGLKRSLISNCTAAVPELWPTT